MFVRPDLPAALPSPLPHACTHEYGIAVLCERRQVADRPERCSSPCVHIPSCACGRRCVRVCVCAPLRANAQVRPFARTQPNPAQSAPCRTPRPRLPPRLAWRSLGGGLGAQCALGAGGQVRASGCGPRTGRAKAYMHGSVPTCMHACMHVCWRARLGGVAACAPARCMPSPRSWQAHRPARTYALVLEGHVHRHS